MDEGKRDPIEAACSATEPVLQSLYALGQAADAFLYAYERDWDTDELTEVGIFATRQLVDHANQLSECLWTAGTAAALARANSEPSIIGRFAADSYTECVWEIARHVCGELLVATSSRQAILSVVGGDRPSRNCAPADEEGMRRQWVVCGELLTAALDGIDYQLAEVQVRKELQRAGRELPPPLKEIPRLSVDLARKVLVFNGTEYDVSSERALRWVAVLAAHPGEWISSGELERYDEMLMSGRTDRFKQYLPPDVVDLIQSDSGKGSRLTLT